MRKTSTQSLTIMAKDDREEMETLLASLQSRDGMVRQRARNRLAEIGHAAVPHLIQLLDHLDAQVRWEGAKTLTAIADPTAAPALVLALEDEDTDVRWVAAEGLIVLGVEALRPLFEALVRRSKSVWFREGAHHVLHELRDGPRAAVITPVLSALEAGRPSMEAAAAAHTALHQLRGTKPVKRGGAGGR